MWIMRTPACVQRGQVNRSFRYFFWQSWLFCCCWVSFLLASWENLSSQN